MITMNVNRAMFGPSRLIRFPANVSEHFPNHQETMLLIVRERLFNCNVNRAAFGNMCNLDVIANQGYDEWMEQEYVVGDIMYFTCIYDVAGVVRVLIINN